MSNTAIEPGITRGPVGVRSYRGCTITKWIAGWAYPQNGNTHNPTPRVKWVVTKAGAPDNASFATLRHAKSFVDEYLAD